MKLYLNQPSPSYSRTTDAYFVIDDGMRDSRQPIIGLTIRRGCRKTRVRSDEVRSGLVVAHGEAHGFHVRE